MNLLGGVREAVLLKDKVQELDEHCRRQMEHIQQMAATKHEQDHNYEQLMERFRNLKLKHVSKLCYSFIEKKIISALCLCFYRKEMKAFFWTSTTS